MSGGEALKVGDEVWLFDGFRRGSAPHRGTVTKVGRRLVTIQANGRDWGDGDPYRIETGVLNSEFSGGSYFLTDTQLADRERVTAARERLTAAGVRLCTPHGYGDADLPPDVLEAVAAVVESAQVGAK